jgi:hypothetical protein
MSHYGQLINSEYEDIQTYDIYSAFTKYFENPVMTKLKDMDRFSMYYARNKAILGATFRYLIAVVPKNTLPFGTNEQLSNLNWVSLQTRTLEEKYNVQTYSYTPTVSEPLTQMISMDSQNEEITVYSCSQMEKLQISLIHTRKNNVFQYPPTGNICAALETYQTVINFR